MNTSDGDILEKAEWLNPTFYHKALKAICKDPNLEIINSNIKLATSPGDNYGSLMVRANFDIKTNGETKNWPLIIKTIFPIRLPEGNDPTRPIFEKEINMLAENLPNFHSYLETVKPGVYPNLSAMCYYHEMDPDPTMLLEDLSVDKFRLAGLFEGFDLDHAVLVVEALARLHATSLKGIEKNPKLKEYQTVWRPGQGDMLSVFVDFGIKTLSEEVEKWEGFAHFSERLKKLRPNFFQKTVEVLRLKDSKLNVILHGDCWANNIMFRYEDGRPVALKLVDFQLSHYGSPCIDLVYFLFSSVNGEIQEKNLEYILKKYHDCFSTLVKDLDTREGNDYSFEDLRKDFVDTLFFGIATSSTVFPVTIAPKDNPLDIVKIIMSSGDYKNDAVYKGKRYTDEMKRMLIFMDNYEII